jgi:two-component system, response regulator, stage 0 sporulation protein F
LLIAEIDLVVHTFVSSDTMQILHTLIVDDDHPYGVFLKKIITARGHSVKLCISADEALKYLQREQVDIMLLDYKMEGTSGINLLQLMYGKKMDIPVILITSYGSEEIYEEAYKWGASEYFIKGEMDSIRLPVLLEQVYSKHRARRTRMSE